ncbi:unnamed protein product [Rotaria sp. Silwood2]|nr:unnamed protein product [Rotaria sp. Silwood2]CAF2797610.1 unnamed protein product [Rotaria sp. Silwood2]CAF3276927.1 unnamed protein product [Rotaria sp. Silwood2]CAF3993796.1 unnamed protein product [Rotaria sp. Silwood2]CAF4083650.1 unnamed protein product [Rotaria sp. Silwood2]
MDFIRLKVIQWSIILIMIADVLCDTKSSKSCPNDSDALQVKIETGDVLYAVTDSQVTILLHSGNGVICQVLNLDNSDNDRERYSIDEHEICCSKDFNDDNELSMIALAQLPKENFVPFMSDD